MSATKEFFDLVSKDASVKAELGEASIKALVELAAKKGFQDDAKKALEAAAAKVAAAHGLKFGGVAELSEQELAAVAGGVECSFCISYSQNSTYGPKINN